MVISQPAAMEIAETCARVEQPFHNLVAWLRRSRPHSPRVLAAAPAGGLTPALPEPDTAAADGEAAGTIDEETEDNAAGPPAAALGLARRRAQAAALRGLLVAQKRHYAEAERCFAEAVTQDPELDLTGLAAFWELLRAGMEAAVRASERAGQVPQAATLAATIRHTFRPRLVAGQQAAAE